MPILIFDHQEQYFDGQGISSEQVNKVGKVLSDKSKVEILKFINIASLWQRNR